MCFPGFLKCDSHMGITLAYEHSVGVISPLGFTYLSQKTVIIWVLWNPWGLAIRTLTSGNGATMAWRPPLFFSGVVPLFFSGVFQNHIIFLLKAHKKAYVFFSGVRGVCGIICRSCRPLGVVGHEALSATCSDCLTIYRRSTRASLCKKGWRWNKYGLMCLRWDHWLPLFFSGVCFFA